jgi:hypothetical protein
MVPVLVAMLVTLGVAAVTTGVVVMGLEGRGRRRAPKLADTMAKAARSLNGDHLVGSRGRKRR